MPTIGKIKVDLHGDTRQFQRSMRRAGRSVNRFRGSLSGLQRRLAVIGGALGFGLLIRRTGEEAIRAQQLADRLNTNVDAFSRLSRVMGRSGIGMNQTAMILQRMVRRAGEAAEGNEQLESTFAELGIDVDKFLKLDPVEAFVQLGEAFAKVGDNSRLLLLAFRVLDSEGVQALQANLGALRQALAETLGISEGQATSITKMAEAWDKLKESVSSALLAIEERFGIFEKLQRGFAAIAQFVARLRRADPDRFQKGMRLRIREAIAKYVPGMSGLTPDPGPPPVHAPMTGKVGGGRSYIGGDLDLTNRILIQIQRNTETTGAIAQ